MEVVIPNEIKSKNPAFVKLLHEINNKLGSNNFEKEESKYWLAKSEWLEEHLIFNTVRSILHEMEFKILHNQLAQDKIKSWKAVMKCFYQSQSPEYYVEKENSLSLQENMENLQHSSVNMADLNDGKKLLSLELEKKLEEMSLKLTDAHDGSDANESKIRLARALQIGKILKEDRSHLESNQQCVKRLKMDYVDLQQKYHQTLHECTDLLTNLISKYCMRLKPIKDDVIVKNAVTSCDTLAMKLKCIRAELKSEDYTERSLDALKKLKIEIAETCEQREMELSDVEQQLEIYRRLGADFEAIATEYSNVKSDLEKQQWTLKEIKQNLRNDTT